MRLFGYRYRTYTWFIIFIVVFLFVLFSIKRKGKRPQNLNKKDRGLFRFDSRSKEIQVRNLKGELILQGDLGINVDPSYSTPEESTKDGLHYTWGDHVILSITKGIKNCLLVDWDSISPEPFTPMDCFHLGKSKWYGGGQLNIPSWPASGAKVDMAPFYSKQYFAEASNEEKQTFTNVFEPYWLSSSGVAIYVDEIVPLHVSMNANGDGKLCLKADTKGYPFHQEPVHLKYRLCFGNNLKSTHTYVVSKFFGKPSTALSKSIVQYPVCTVKSANQNIVEKFFRRVVIRQFACGHINIGPQHGLQFDKNSFNNPGLLIGSIQRKKINVMTVVDDSFSSSSSEYKDVPKGYLVAGSYSLDLGKDEVVNWFIEKVKNFKEKYSIDSIRLCCGEIKFPVDYYKLGKDQNPGMIMHNYAKVAANLGQFSDIKVGYKSQSMPLVIKISDRTSAWGRDIGLRSIISMVLSVGILGYPFVTIGPIGGHAVKETRPDKELYIRWMQLSAFFPIMEFTVYPWEYDDEETIHISAEVLDIRSMLWESILKISKESVKTGSPVVRPMWWIAPYDPDTYNLNSQFMLGDIYLVAPILWPKKTKQDVYLPKGVWREMFGKGKKWEISVGRWVTIAVDLRTVVYFECLLCKN